MAFGFNNDRTKVEIYSKAQTDGIVSGLLPRDLAASTYQPLLSFDSSPTANSSNPVTSSGIKAAIDALGSTIDARLDALEELIPSPTEGDEPLSDWLVEEGQMTTAHSEAVDDDDHAAETHWNNKNVTWHYRKWNSGFLEAWATQIDTWAIVANWGNGLYRGSCLARQELPYEGTAANPQYLFVERPYLCEINVIGQNASLWTVCGNKAKYDRTSTFAFFPVTDGGPWDTEPVIIEYYVLGRWK